MPLTPLAAVLGATLSFVLVRPAERPAAAPPAPGPVRIEGRIRDGAGRPVAGALVIARRIDVRLLARPATARSDARGAFSVALDAAGDYALRVESSGLAPSTVDRVRAPATGLVVTLERGATLEGVVKDGRGRPVAGARVEAQEWKEWRASPLMEAGAGRVRTTTDARGSFRLAGLAAAAQSVQASARGVGGARRDGVRPGQRIELFLAPSGAVAGTVQGADGRPLAGASIALEPEKTRPGLPLAERSNERGAFEFGGVAPGAWRVLAWQPGLAPALARVLTEKGSERAVALTLGPPSRLSGRLVDGEGRPQRGSVTLQEIEGQLVLSTLGQVLRAESDAQGHFVLDGMPRRSIAVAVTARGLAARRVEAAPVEARLDLGDVVLERGLTIAGRVTDDSDRAVAGAHVSASGRQARRAVMDGTTDGDGGFVLSGADPGGYRIGVQAPGFAEAVVNVTAGDAPIDIGLRRAASVVGTVVDEKGIAVPAFGVMALAPLPTVQGPGGFGQMPWVTEGSDGRFAIEDLAPGAWSLTVQSPRSRPAKVADVKVVAGAATDVGVVRLAPGASLRGRVTDAAGAPVAGASLRAHPRGSVRLWGVGEGAFTDASGAFELSGFEPGRVDLVATHPSFAQAHLDDFEVGSDAAAEAHLVMTRGGRVEGRVHRRGGRPVEGMSVATSPPGDGTSTVPVGPDGTFRIETVPAGAVTVTLSGETGDLERALLEKREIVVAEGASVAVDFALQEVLVAGTVVRGGEPAGGVRISFHGRGPSGGRYGVPAGAVVQAPPGAPLRDAATTRDDGGYELLVGEPGTYAVSVASADGRASYFLGQVVVPDADAASFDFTLAGLTVAGTTVDAESGKPLQAHVSATREGDPMRAGRSASGGPDGRFALELEPGSYSLQASAEGYRTQDVPLRVGDVAIDDVHFSLARSLRIGGRVVDATGAAVAYVWVSALPDGPGGAPKARAVQSESRPDGTFLLDGLAAGSYTVTAALHDGRGEPAFGMQPAVAAGASNVVLRMGPVGWVRVTVAGPGGSPAGQVALGVRRLDGHPVSGFGGASTREGSALLMAPLGRVEVGVLEGPAQGAAEVNVTAGEPATVNLTVTPR